MGLIQVQKQALYRLDEIMEEANGLAEEAEELMRAHFPMDIGRANAYKCFETFSSSNPYDVTLHRIVQDIWKDHYDNGDEDEPNGYQL